MSLGTKRKACVSVQKAKRELRLTQDVTGQSQ